MLLAIAGARPHSGLACDSGWTGTCQLRGGVSGGGRADVIVAGEGEAALEQLMTTGFDPARWLAIKGIIFPLTVGRSDPDGLRRS